VASKSALTLTILLSVCLGLFCGCGRSGTELTEADARAFDGAPTELKQYWAQANAAAATNDYVQAIFTLRSLLRQSLTAEQLAAVQKALEAFDAQMMEAVARGDANAKKALETLSSSSTQISR
jgi:hypothetical protein